MDYGGLNAKVKALSGRLIRDDDYKALSQLRNTEELRNKLLETREYALVIANAPEESVRYRLEQTVYMTLADELSRILKFVSDHNTRVFLDSFYLSQEIRIIKILLCMFYDEREIDFSHTELELLIGKSLKIDVRKIIAAKTLPEFIDELRETKLYPVLETFYHGATLFELETRLDLFYYVRIAKVIKKTLTGVNRRIALSLIRAEIDMKNIIWLYRLKTYYKLTDNMIYANLIPYNGRLSRSLIGRMVEARTAEELGEEIARSPYGRVFAKARDGGESFENAFRRELIRLYSFFESMHPNSIAVTLSYLFKKEQEIKNVISLIEGVRYALAPEEIMESVVIEKRVL